MLIISGDVIKEIGFQLEPSLTTMGQYARVVFERMTNELATKEAELIREKQKIEKLDILAKLVSNLAMDDPRNAYYHEQIKLLLES